MSEEERAPKRAAVAALDEILDQEIRVLDRGFVRVVDYMGDDAAIVQAARVSYGKGTKSLRDDTALIRYLLRHRHTSPFEMCELKLHVKLPIFVARQWIRHRTANVNEYSARYSVMEEEFYLPEAGQLGVQSSENRQGRGDGLRPDDARDVRRRIAGANERAYELYLLLLNSAGAAEAGSDERLGLTRELARIVLPLNTYTEWYWKTDLHNLLHFLALRADPHAQYEIRAYAEALLDVVRRWLPITCQAFLDYQLNAATLSAPALAVVKRMVAGETVLREESGLGAREWRELMALLERPG
jgi:thymidylate synthase (FAD)